jgi:hypothetical protein
MTSITPANPQADPDADLRRAVAVAYRTGRQRGDQHHVAWALRLRPEMTPQEAGDRTCSIISWASREHAEWFWRGVGAANPAAD